MPGLRGYLRHIWNCGSPHHRGTPGGTCHANNLKRPRVVYQRPKRRVYVISHSSYSKVGIVPAGENTPSDTATLCTTCLTIASAALVEGGRFSDRNFISATQSDARSPLFSRPFVVIPLESALALVRYLSATSSSPYVCSRPNSIYQQMA